MHPSPPTALPTQGAISPSQLRCSFETPMSCLPRGTAAGRRSGRSGREGAAHARRGAVPEEQQPAAASAWDDLLWGEAAAAADAQQQQRRRGSGRAAGAPQPRRSQATAPASVTRLTPAERDAVLPLAATGAQYAYYCGPPVVALQVSALAAGLAAPSDLCHGQRNGRRDGRPSGRGARAGCAQQRRRWQRHCRPPPSPPHRHPFLPRR